MKRETLCFVAALVLLMIGSALAAAPGHLEGYVPAVARVEGKFGSFWTSDLWIYQQGASTIHLWFNREDEDNTDRHSVVVQLDGPVTRIEDVVGSIFATEGVGSVHYLAYLSTVDNHTNDASYQEGFRFGY